MGYGAKIGGSGSKIEGSAVMIGVFVAKIEALG